MKLRWLGQSGYELQTDSSTLLLDPYLSDSVNRKAGRPRLLPIPLKPAEVWADAVICTHNHLDHLDPDSIVQMPADLQFMTTAEGAQKLHELGRRRVLILRPGDCITLGEWTIHAVYARHSVEAFGVVIQACGLTLYFSGDTLFDPRLAEVKQFKPDYAFICINGKLGNMKVEEAACLAQLIGARVSIPNHYGMFASNTEDPRRFTDLVAPSRSLSFNQVYSLT
ncbi:MBL fold metallo-hydrolase [Oscillospiraceae bacterium HV4-5-C5C]|nr:MBL fold metallo-hydrolase [Oscillospiraceae bacterium HV4-5-C5C]